MQLNSNEMNELIDKYLKNEELDFGRVIFEPNKNISIVLEYTPLLNETEFISISETNGIEFRNDIENYCYGVSPIISSDVIIKEISKLTFRDEKGLEDFVLANRKCFMLRTNQAKYLNAISKYLVLSMTYNYGVGFLLPRELLDKAQLREKIDFIHKECKINNKKENIYYLIGCPTQKTINFFSQYKYTRYEKYFTIADEGVTFEEIYQDLNNIVLANTNVFYSGVFLRPLQINRKENYYSNKGVLSYSIKFEKSTYATVYGFDCLRAIHNELLQRERGIIGEFFAIDDKIIDETIKK